LLVRGPASRAARVGSVHDARDGRARQHGARKPRVRGLGRFRHRLSRNEVRRRDLPGDVLILLGSVLLAFAGGLVGGFVCGYFFAEDTALERELERGPWWE